MDSLRTYVSLTGSDQKKYCLVSLVNISSVVTAVAGRKYGYVKYASGESARQAVDLLHGQMICGNRIKVMIAEKPRYPLDSSSRQSDKRKFPSDFDVEMDQGSKRTA